MGFGARQTGSSHFLVLEEARKGSDSLMLRQFQELQLLASR